MTRTQPSTTQDDARRELDRYLDVEETESRRVQPETARRLFQTMLRHSGVLAMGCAFVVAGTGAALVEPRLFGYAIDEAIIPRDWNRFVQLTAIFVVVIVMRVTAMIGQAYLFESLGQALTQDLRVAVFSRFQQLPLSTYDKHPAGRLMTRVTNDINALGEVFSAGFVTMVSNALLVAGILVWFVILSPRLGLITISVFPFMAYATVRFSKQLAISYRDARSKLSALNAFLAENLMGIKVVHLFNRQHIHLDRFYRLNQLYTDAQVKTIRTYAFLQPAITLAGGASMALLIWFGSNDAINGRIRVGVLVACFAYALALFRPLRDIADKWNVFLAGLAAAERIYSVLEWQTEFPDDRLAGPATPYSNVQGHIVFENVWFAYDDEHWVLKNINLEIPAGIRIGIVGHTGSGKTTLISLLMRFYEPQKGRILLDGKDLRDYDKRRLRATLGLVQQDVFLFSGSMSDNISLFASSPESESESIFEQHGFSDEKLLSERGGNLSAGERQLVAFARAYRAQPRIWILDEPTSNVDSTNERRLEQALSRASEGKTVIVIAHRLATTRSCDQLVVLNKGQIVEFGDHGSLMRKNGLYARLFRYQQVIGN